MLKNPANYRFYLGPSIFTVIFLFTSVSQSKTAGLWNQENKIIFSSEIKYIVRSNNDLYVNNLGFSNQNACSVAHGSKLLWGMINKRRTQTVQCGTKSFASTKQLSFSCELTRIAQRHAEDLAEQGRMSHISSDGANLKKRVNRVTRRWLALAENLAYGPQTPQGVHRLWLNSPEHCANMMNSGYNSVGLGRAGEYWVAVFGKLL